MDSLGDLSADARIGKRVQSARGKITQSDVAKRMKDLGHKWSQSTVWAVEKGERSLKLNEAQDLAVILQGSVLDFIVDVDGSNEYLNALAEITRFDKITEDLLATLAHWVALREDFYAFSLWLKDGDNILKIPESKRAELLSDVDNIVGFDFDAVVIETIGWVENLHMDGRSKLPIEDHLEYAPSFLRELRKRLNKTYHDRMDENGVDPEAS